jgi:hypothetical protein
VNSSILTSPLLDEARYKICRGKEHYYALDAELQKFWDSKPCIVAHEYDDKQSKNLFRFKVQRAAPLSAWALIIGDAVHNARSALDYIAWRIAGGDISDRVTLFPICESSGQFEDATQRRLRRVHPDAVAAIRKLQPYHRPNVQESALWLLETLENRDKHKLLTPTQSFIFMSSFEFYDPLPCTLPLRPGSRVEHDAVVVEVPGAPNADPNMKLEFSLDILFERGVVSASADYEVRQGLIKIFDAVDIVIAAFDRLLVKNPDWVPEP